MIYVLWCIAIHALLESGNPETFYAELRRWPFIRSRREGLAVHDTMREMINEALHVRTPDGFRTLHERAATYYKTRLEKATGDERERYTLERLYHRVRTDEGSGMQLFQEIAEELTHYRMVNRLRTLLCDVNSYPLESENSVLWREYYNARLAYLEARISHAEEIYQKIGKNERVEPKLRAYVLCDWGEILCRRERFYQPGVEEKAVHLLESSLKVGGSIDLKLAMSWVYLSDVYIAKCNWEKALFYLDKSKGFFTEHANYLGSLIALECERGVYARQGNLRKMFDVEKEMWNIYAEVGEPSYLRTRLSLSLEWLWAGHYAESEKDFRVVVEAARSLQDQEYLCRRTRDLALSLGLQDKCSEALVTSEEALYLARNYGSGGDVYEVFLALFVYGVVCFKCGKLDRTEEYLTEAITLGQKIHTHLDAALLYLATVYEVLKEFDKAERFYQLAKTEAYQISRNYFMCGAPTGLARVKHVQKDYPAIPLLWTEAEQLAQQYEYNDYFTSLYLTRGHIAWDSLIPEWESGFDAALHYYQLVLIHALRFNRFLLDEVLAGREEGTPLQPIIQHCLERGKEGQRMLVALRDWWQTGVNKSGTPRPNTISPLPEEIALLEAEKMARQREPGDGSTQTSVVDQINTSLR
jgi:tetratricopeptide (TPR) repeat protein